jgi:hypothetical protein
VELPNPRFTGSARPLEDAFRIAQVELVHWPRDEYGLAMLDAYQLVSQAVEAPLANVVDTNYTSVAKIRKEWPPGAAPMDAYTPGCASKPPTTWRHADLQRRSAVTGRCRR